MVFLQYHGTTTPLFEGGDDICFGADGIVKLGGIATNTEVRMRIAAACRCQPQGLAGVYGKAIFAICTGAIAHFNAIHQS